MRSHSLTRRVARPVMRVGEARKGAIIISGGFREMGMSEAYCGQPAEATAAEGEETFSTLTDLLVEAIRELARE